MADIQVLAWGEPLRDYNGSAFDGPRKTISIDIVCPPDWDLARLMSEVDTALGDGENVAFRDPERQQVIYNRCMEIMHYGATYSMETLQQEPWKLVAWKLLQMVQHITGYPEGKEMPTL